MRDAFARDRDRLIHATAFRRLRHKTQVFVAPEGDHFRVRLTHSLEVAQIARTLARVLAVNEDLAEVVALGHDVGHPPFGHSGEEALAAAMAHVGGFDHNGHALRVLAELELRTPAFAGLNLSWEVLEGLAKHNGPVTGTPGWALADVDAAFPLELESWPALEAQLAALADDIAYNAHDLDDALGAGLVDVEEAAAEVPLIGVLWRQVKAEWPGETRRRLLVPQLVRELIGAMVDSLLAETRDRLRALSPEFPDDIRRAGRATVAFGPGMEEELAPLRTFLRARMYEAASVQALREPAAAVVRGLFAALQADPARLPGRWRALHAEAAPDVADRVIGDFIAGMTDRYAIRTHAELTGTNPMPADLALF
ncbi:MAG: deoxyguanosinetriphosphate triphosphohydrolase family protein [Thermaurantiacus tibetensis]